MMPERSSTPTAPEITALAGNRLRGAEPLAKEVVIIDPEQVNQENYEHGNSNVVDDEGDDEYSFSASRWRASDALNFFLGTIHKQNLQDAAWRYCSARRKLDSWCRKRNVNPVLASIECVLEFLPHEFNAGKAYRTLNVYRSAISNTPLPLVVQLLKGAYNLAPCSFYSYNYKIRSDLVPPELEAVCLEITKPQSKPFIATTIYRPPNATAEFFDHLEKNLLNKLMMRIKKCTF